jgi:agmatinase
VWRHGIATDAPVQVDGTPEGMVEAVQRRTAEHLQRGRFPVIIGGEHSVSIGAIRAHAERRPEMTVLQLDAHGDSRDSYQGSRYNHACVMARARECCPIVQVGVRSMDASEMPSVEPGRMFYAKDIHNDSAWIERVVDPLSPQVYLTIDLDVLDPAFMPATGTPEPGGLSWYQVLGLVKAVCDRCHVVGFDVVELCPLPHHRASDFLAAKLIYTLLSYRFQKINSA